MKLLWVCPFLLHPTKSGSQIRTLGIIRELHRRHEVHFAALLQSHQAEEGLARAREYCSRLTTVPHVAPHRTSLAFLPQLAGSFFSEIPLSVSRYASSELRSKLEKQIGEEKYDVILADFLFSTPNIPEMSRAVLFQHNVEAVIWKRLVEHASTPLHKAYFGHQARRMESFERTMCQTARHVIAVSPVDAKTFQAEYGLRHVSSVPTGVDLDYFRPPEKSEFVSDLVFTGGMDWMPNIDGMEWFAQSIWPLIRARRPETRLTVVGRKPLASILRMAEQDPLIRVTGTVPDIRPYLWGSSISIVPLRIGSGTRLKIYEAMAAGTPVVSTTIGAEGLEYTHGRNLLIADAAEDFAARCLDLLADADLRRQQSREARDLVESRFSWARITDTFEALLRNA